MPKPIAATTVVTAAFLNDLTGVYDRTAAALDIVSSGAETTLYSKTVTGGHMSTNRMLRLTLVGDYFNNSAATRTLQLKVKFGGTTIFDDTAGDAVNAITVSAARRPLILQLWLGNQGATNAQFLGGFVSIGQPGGATTGIGDLAQMTLGSGSGTNQAFLPITSDGVAALDTTTDKLLDITVTHSAANASLSVRRQYAVLELL